MGARLSAAATAGFRLMDAMACVLLLALTLLTTLDVAGRNLIRHPVPGATELTEVLLAAIVFLSFPRLAYRGAHIVVDMLDTLVTAALRALQRRLVSVLGAVAFIGLTWPLTRLGLRSLENNDTTVQLGISLGYPILLMAALCLLAGLAFLAAPGARGDEVATAPMVD